MPSDLIWSPAVVYAVEDLTGEKATTFTAWFKALFDSNSEGIEDTLLRCVAFIPCFILVVDQFVEQRNRERSS